MTCHVSTTSVASNGWPPTKTRCAVEDTQGTCSETSNKSAHFVVSMRGIHAAAPGVGHVLPLSCSGTSAECGDRARTFVQDTRIVGSRSAHPLAIVGVVRIRIVTNSWATSGIIDRAPVCQNRAPFLCRRVIAITVCVVWIVGGFFFVGRSENMPELVGER